MSGHPPVGDETHAYNHHGDDRVPSPGGWAVPAGARPGSTWVPPIHGAQPAPERMPWWVRVWSHVPLVDRYAHEWMWHHGGYLVFPPDHPFNETHGPDQYAALTGVSKEEYEHRLLAVSRDALHNRFTGGAVTVESIDLDREDLGTRIVVLFRLADRPSKRFGWSVKVWPSPHPDDYDGTPEWGELLPTFLAEELAEPSRLSGEPDAQGVTWLAEK
jgi:hypothetical protein